MPSRRVQASTVLLSGVALALSGCSPPSNDSRGQSLHPFEEKTRALTNEERGRAIYVAGLSFGVPAGGKLTYPQGVDSAVMMITGPGFEVNFDDYGSFRGPATIKIAGAPTALTELRAPGCHLRHWEIKLPTSSPYVFLKSPKQSGSFKAPAHANVVSLCTGTTACAQVDAVIRSARFSSRPWPQMPPPDPAWRPSEPVCRV